MTIAFFIPTEPQGKQSPRAVKINGFARVVKDPKTRKYEDMIALFASQAMNGRAPLDEPVAIAIDAVFSVPVSWSLKKQRAALAGQWMPTRRPDVSNILKACEDGCNGIVFRDDSLVVEATIVKVFGAIPGVQVMVRPAVTAVPVVVPLTLELEPAA